MSPRPPRLTRTYTLFPYTTRFRSHVVDPGRDPDRLRARRPGRVHQGVLSGGVEHRDLRGDGRGAPVQARRPLRTGAVTAMATGTQGMERTTGLTPPRILLAGGLLVLAVAAPFVLYPVFLDLKSTRLNSSH